MASIVDYSTLDLCSQKGISFAAYSLPGEDKFNLIAQKTDALEINETSDQLKGYIFHPFKQDKSSPILLIKNDFHLREGDKADDLIQFLNSKNDTEIKEYKFNHTSEEEYLSTFEAFKSNLNNDRFLKLVLSRIKNIKLNDNFSIIDFFKRLIKTNVYAFDHLIYTPQSGIWIGSSPEVLLNLDSEIGQTVALAGTQKKNIENEYQWGEKEIEEQKFVVDYIKGILTNHIPEENIITDYKTSEAGKMVHLKTNFQFPAQLLKNYSDLINQLHPTPAVCGLPKHKAQEFIIQNEKHNRSYYTGFMGPFNINKKSHLFVNLRSASYSKNTLSLFLGGGLTKDSVAEKEWEETELKATTLQSLL